MSHHRAHPSLFLGGLLVAPLLAFAPAGCSSSPSSSNAGGSSSGSGAPAGSGDDAGPTRPTGPMGPTGPTGTGGGGEDAAAAHEGGTQAEGGASHDAGSGDSGQSDDAGSGDASVSDGGCSSCQPPANGTMWGPQFVPYSAQSIWNTPLPSVQHTYASDSAAIIAVQFPSSTNTYSSLEGDEPNQYDPSNQGYFATASDPVVNIDCSGSNSCGPNVPATMHIPATAHINASNNDNIMFVVQPDGTEIDFYCWDVYDGHNCEPPGWSSQGDGTWSDGDTISGAWTTNCGNFFSGAGWDGAGSASDGAHALGYGAGGNCAGAGLLNASELSAGVINHALQILTACTQNAAVYPGYWEASGPNPCTGAAPPIGYRLWYDVACSDTQANAALDPWETAILCALNVYGGFVTDNGSDQGAMQPGFGIRDLGEVPSFEFGTGDQWAQLSSQGWSPYAVGGDWTSSFPRWGLSGPHSDGNGNWMPPGVDFSSHMHYLDPCVTQGTCP